MNFKFKPRLLAMLQSLVLGAALSVTLAQSKEPVKGPMSELVVLVDTATEMPLAHFQDGQLQSGIHKELGDALAARLGRTPRYLVLPRKRIELALTDGAADVLCMYLPQWLPGKFDWSIAFYPMAEVLITERAAPRPQALTELAGQPVGTLLGFVYPEMEAALGAAFVRDDAPSSVSNLLKMRAGRIRHVITSQVVLDYRQKMGQVPPLHAPLLIKNYRAQCALSERSQVSLADLNKALAAMQKDGTLAAMAQRYQGAP